MDNFKRSLKRLLTRLTILSLVVVGGAIAIAQAQKEREAAAANTADLTQPGATQQLTSVGDDTLAGLEDPLRGLTPPPSTDNRPSTDSRPITNRPSVDPSALAAPRFPASHPTTMRDPQVQLAQATDSASRFGGGGNDDYPADSDFGAAPTTDRFGAASNVDSLDPPPLMNTSSPPQSGNNVAFPPDNTFPALPRERPTTQFTSQPQPNRIEVANAATGAPEGLQARDAFSSDPVDARNNPVRAGGQRQPIRQPAPIDDQFGDSQFGAAPADFGPDTAAYGDPQGIPQDGYDGRSDFGQTQNRTNDDFQNPYDPATAMTRDNRGQFAAPQENGQREQDFGGSNFGNNNFENNNFGGDNFDNSRENFGAGRVEDTSLDEQSYGGTQLDPNEGQGTSTGLPGPRELEGPQTPSLTIQKIAPTNVRVGQPATFEIRVRNVGQVPVDRVLIRDEIPRGSTLMDTAPPAQRGTDGAVLWQVGTLRAGEDVTVSMQVKPTDEGTIGSVATVTIQGQASARAEATKPMLTVTHTGPQTVLVGEPVRFQILLENPGSGPAETVIIEEDVPEGLSHSKGPILEHEIGTIAAGGSRSIELTLTAAKQGRVENIIRARGAGGLIAEHRIELDVIAPDLQLRIQGPSRRYLERKATFTLRIENPGTAPASQVDLLAKLPQGLTFVSTNNSGRYDSTTNTVRWRLEKLPANKWGEVQFTALPAQVGDYNINAEATSGPELRSTQDHRMVVEGIAALLFGVVDQTDPIEVGEVTTYEINVKNQGTKTASNVQFVAQLPQGLQAVDAEGPTNYRISGDQVVFESIPSLAAKGESAYRIRVKGVSAGDQRFRVRMTSDDIDEPVFKEESTKVYAD